MALAIYREREEVAKPKTNGDKIRAMTDEELAEFLETDTCCKFCVLGDYDEKCNWYEKCDERIFQWLKQEVQEDE